MTPRVRLLAALPLLLLPLSACGSDDGGRAADRTPATTSPAPDETGSTSSDSSGPSPSGTAKHREFAPTDYAYRLRVLCFCPQVGPVEITVRDGAVADAVLASGPRKGAPAPEYARLTINDILAKAADPAVAKATVRWPAGQDHPSAVRIDRIAEAVDDEVSYTIKDVRVTP